MRMVTSRDGTPIAVHQAGAGPPIVLMGAAFMTRAGQAGLAAALASTFTVFAYDRRGRGDSGDTPPYAVAREVEDLTAVLAAAGGAAGVFGHSSGAVLALETARVHPAQITQLALYEPPFIVDASRPPVPENFATHLQAPWWPALAGLAHTLPYDAALMAGLQAGDPAPLGRWAAVAVPTLVLDGTLTFGRADLHAFMRHGADALAAVLPRAQRRTLAGQDHGPADDVLAAALQAFFLT